MRKLIIISFSLVVCLFMASQTLTYERVQDAERTTIQANNRDKALPGVLMLLLDDEDEVMCEVDLDCDDGNPCTDNRCDPETGCIYDYNSDPCDDGNICTVNNICENGVCVGDPLVCDDGDPCTDNRCDPETGCYYVEIPGCTP